MMLPMYREVGGSVIFIYLYVITYKFLCNFYVITYDIYEINMWLIAIYVYASYT